jgi:hypothetical protein
LKVDLRDAACVCTCVRRHVRADTRQCAHSEKDANTGKVNPITTEQGETLKADVGAVLYMEVSAKEKTGATDACPTFIADEVVLRTERVI